MKKKVGNPRRKKKKRKIRNRHFSTTSSERDLRPIILRKESRRNRFHDEHIDCRERYINRYSSVPDLSPISNDHLTSNILSSSPPSTIIPKLKISRSQKYDSQLQPSTSTVPKRQKKSKYRYKSVVSSHESQKKEIDSLDEVKRSYVRNRKQSKKCEILVDYYKNEVGKLKEHVRQRSKEITKLRIKHSQLVHEKKKIFTIFTGEIKKLKKIEDSKQKKIMNERRIKRRQLEERIQKFVMKNENQLSQLKKKFYKIHQMYEKKVKLVSNLQKKMEESKYERENSHKKKILVQEDNDNQKQLKILTKRFCEEKVAMEKKYTHQINFLKSKYTTSLRKYESQLRGLRRTKREDEKKMSSQYNQVTEHNKQLIDENKRLKKSHLGEIQRIKRKHGILEKKILVEHSKKIKKMEIESKKLRNSNIQSKKKNKKLESELISLREKHQEEINKSRQFDEKIMNMENKKIRDIIRFKKEMQILMEKKERERLEIEEFNESEKLFQMKKNENLKKKIEELEDVIIEKDQDLKNERKKQQQQKKKKIIEQNKKISDEQKKKNVSFWEGSRWNNISFFVSIVICLVFYYFQFS